MEEGGGGERGCREEEGEVVEEGEGEEEEEEEEEEGEGEGW